MISISFRFLAGRYHATPWGRHVNEGAIEWPPSPWRILRALVATWKRTLPDLPLEQVEPILRALLGPPEFVLPAASTGHTRHYMPWFKKGPDDRTLVFDTFVAVCSDTPLRVQWPDASLDESQRRTLARILANLNTFGRSESWVEAELTDGVDDSAGFVCRPLQDEAPEGCEIVRLLCADPSTALENGKFTDCSKGKPTYDPGWRLCVETLWLHKEKWSDPPGSEWVQYTRPRDCFKTEPRPRPSRANNHPRIHAVRFALDSAVLPLVTETLPVAEAARRALMFHLVDIRGRKKYGNAWSRDEHKAGRMPVSLAGLFSGKDKEGKPLTGHRHAYYLPTDEDGDGRLDHLTIYAADGFGLDERRAFDRLRRLNTGRKGEERHPLRLLLLGLGTSDEYRPGPLAESKVWVSATPYIAARHAKTRGRHRIDPASPEARAAFLEDDLRARIAAVRPDLADKATIKPEWDDNHVFKVAGRRRTIQFKRFRQKRGDDGGRRLAGAFLLTFPRPVSGPITFGWSSHFGMGLFVPADRETLE